MAIYAHNLTEQDIIDDYPSSSGAHIGESTQGLNFRKIRGWRDQAAGIVNAILKRHGIDPEALEEGSDEAQVARAAIKAYAVAKMFFVAGRREEGRDHMSEWSEIKKGLESEPENLGDAQLSSSGTVTNVPATQAASDTWGGDWTGW